MDHSKQQINTWGSDSIKLGFWVVFFLNKLLKTLSLENPF